MTTRLRTGGPVFPGVVRWEFVGQGDWWNDNLTLAVPIAPGIQAGDWRFVTYGAKLGPGAIISSKGTAAATKLGQASQVWTGVDATLYSAAFVEETETTQISVGHQGVAFDSAIAHETAFRYTGDATVAVTVTDFGIGPQTRTFRPPAVTVGKDSLVVSMVTVTQNAVFTLDDPLGFKVYGSSATFLGSDVAIGTAARFVPKASTVRMPRWLQTAPGLVNTHFCYSTVVVGRPVP